MVVLSSAIVANALSITGRIPFSTLFGSLTDKVYHVAAFALLAAIAEFPGPAPRSLWALVLLAAGIEIVQLALPDRLAEVWDFVSSVMGVALGWGVAILVRRVALQMSGEGWKKRGR